MILTHHNLVSWDLTKYEEINHLQLALQLWLTGVGVELGTRLLKRPEFAVKHLGSKLSIFQQRARNNRASYEDGDKPCKPCNCADSHEFSGPSSVFEEFGCST